jgi:hypothetical protein
MRFPATQRGPAGSARASTSRSAIRRRASQVARPVCSSTQTERTRACSSNSTRTSARELPLTIVSASFSVYSESSRPSQDVGATTGAADSFSGQGGTVTTSGFASALPALSANNNRIALCRILVVAMVRDLRGCGAATLLGDCKPRADER